MRELFVVLNLAGKGTHEYYPEGDVTDFYNVYAYGLAQTLVPMLLPGVKINTSPTDFYPIEQMQLQRFDGKQWILFGDLIDA
jgi:branched-chain amino acid transport system substrate-binding protein